MNQKLQPQLKNAEEIKAILKEVPFSFTLNDGRKVKTLLVYLTSENNGIGYSEFFRIVKDGILSNFVFSCSEVERKLGLQNKKSAEELFDKAIRKLSKHTAKGELGELILFTLLDIYFKAPKILSKISLKTASRIPVFGADAVHCQFHDEKLELYLGESKLYKNFGPAATSTATSIKTAKDKYAFEFDLIDSHMDFPNIDEKFESELLNLLNPFSGIEISDVIHSPCFIGFSAPRLMSDNVTESGFIKDYKKLAEVYIGDFFRKVESEEMDINKVSLLILPFTCVDELVDEFVTYMGIQN
ncbi:HamA C-terminal domain-containing protein [Paremcibacter congregatus]|uniref:Anti-bacteriophage protein A/HamA C-terminal domain-containing protein n=1 Tax=Paremcibacter congregatus TaxID=2043170 RepID=A0A2G4YMC3_9PROT|nr:DUF1837 domain-containing protein [Paremcibacter congregatus]PHZ83474.1 hypothetical protein CRD36_18130 [Paremcibacter congregatus]QDE28059.1 DUF1837 domain-containing protein [Paremcibacter congregatus]